MAEKETILRVKDLRISFRTVSGKVQAVRNINFDLAKGETLAIVGESGSGKSVTNRAIMGILAKNGIIESGEVLYNGMDLLKISEREFCHIRGDKIAMIFQDPLSSLNPIIRIGRQLTEATLLKNKANRRDAAHNFDHLTDELAKAMAEANVNDPASAEKAKAFLENFKKAKDAFLKVQTPYAFAYTELKNAKDEVDDFEFNVVNKVSFDPFELLREIKKFVKNAEAEYVLEDKEALPLVETLFAKAKELKKDKAREYSALSEDAKLLKQKIDDALAKPQPALFAYTYFTLIAGASFPANASVEEKNKLAEEKLQSDFVLPFEGEIVKALKFSHDRSYKAMAEAKAVLSEKRSVFGGETL
jgi:ABC-type dipeptide/oligopeptide/nickel transport system ATPase component